MATASQKMTDTRFLDLIRGALMAAPTRDDPVMKMPQAAPQQQMDKQYLIQIFRTYKKWRYRLLPYFYKKGQCMAAP